MTTSHKRCDDKLRNPEVQGFCLSDVQRFWAKVERRSGLECWPWKASVWNSGYGQFRVQLPGRAGRQQTWGAHRAAYALSHGPIPEGASVLHACDNRLCCNPAHLFIGTQADNMADAAVKGRLHAPRPKRQKVTDEDCDVALRWAQSGVMRVEIARRLGVTKTWVTRFLKGDLRQYRRPATHRRSA